MFKCGDLSYGPGSQPVTAGNSTMKSNGIKCVDPPTTKLAPPLAMSNKTSSLQPPLQAVALQTTLKDTYLPTYLPTLLGGRS